MSERNRILGADFVTRSNYFVTSDRRLGARRPRLSLRDATGSRRFRFDRPTASITLSGGSSNLKREKTGIAMCAGTLPSIGLIVVYRVELSLDVSSRPRRPSYTPFAN